MTVRPAINVQTPTNITATTITAKPGTPCLEGTCISVAWQNIGDIAGSSVPNISIDGTPITPIYSYESVDAVLAATHICSIWSNKNMQSAQYMPNSKLNQ